MSISGIGRSTDTYYTQLSSGKKINSAADDAAGLAIAEKLESQRNSYDVGKDNAATGQNMINVADGALGSITDSLQRMRELSIQASSSALYSDDDIAAMQKEVDQLKQHISDVASNTQFNTKNLLDGTLGGVNIATNPDGSGSTVNMPNATLDALGIADYDLNGNFDISVLDDALSKVSEGRSSLGAQSNGLDYTMNYNSYASYNLTASKSRIEDLDYGKAMSDLKKNQVMEQYKIYMMKERQDQDGSVTRLLNFN